MSGRAARPSGIAVIDIGKTNAKVLLVAPDGTEVAERRCPNTVVPGPPYPHFDAARLWDFVVSALAGFAPKVGAIVPVTHGACAALVRADGELAGPVLDYEFDGPDETRATYAPPPFAETGSPPLAGGLNLGAQLHWIERTCPDVLCAAEMLLPWPQWWAWRLSGVAASEVTSLGCHTDLWDPHRAVPSSLARARGWDRLLPPMRRAGDILGPLRASVAEETGLHPATPVLTGLHDSNASLLPYLSAQPCGVLSTGTWIIACALGGAPVKLDPAADMLLNVAVNGAPVPTARFMGGRLRAERVEAGAPRADVDREIGHLAGLRLQEIGADGPVFVEGPFSASPAFIEGVAEATGRPAIPGEGAGTSRGAARLVTG
ncbi:FGGY family carbohydrate kinase [Stappia sp.]|uniref:FGGY-family carbohydrate kinase n=1 Tax=Stappia sp. TaxID=1870903 RepID=UPI0032D99A96